MVAFYPSLNHFLGWLNENCLILARHGETDWNALDLLQGQQDRPLSIKGFQQRKNLFFQLQSVPLAKIYTSALQRTITTAEPLSIEQGIPLETMEALNEAKLGVFEGEHKFQFADAHSKKMYRAFTQDEVNRVLPGGGENLKMVYARLQPAMQTIMEAVSSLGHVLVIAHRNVNKMILKGLLGLSFEQGFLLEHKHHWVYIFAPRAQQMFWYEIGAPTGNIEVHEGYFCNEH